MISYFLVSSLMSNCVCEANPLSEGTGSGQAKQGQFHQHALRQLKPPPSVAPTETIFCFLICWIHFQECLGAITRCLTSKCQECLGVPPTSMGTVEQTTCHERRLASQAVLQRPCPCWASESDASCSTSEIGMEVTWCLLGVTPSVWRHGSVEKIQVQRKKINKHSVI